MRAVVARLVILAAGLGILEIALPSALVSSPVVAWLGVGIGLVLTTAGSLGFMAPLLGARRVSEDRE